MHMMTICTPMREDETKGKGQRVGPRYKGRENMEKESDGTNDRRQDDTTVREEGKEGRGRKEEKRRKKRMKAKEREEGRRRGEGRGGKRSGEK